MTPDQRVELAKALLERGEAYEQFLVRDIPGRLKP